MATVEAPSRIVSEQRFLLNCITWEDYETIGRVLQDQNVRLNDSDGNLELMTLSHEHEWIKKFLARIVEILTQELNIDRKSGGSTTF